MTIRTKRYLTAHMQVFLTMASPLANQQTITIRRTLEKRKRNVTRKCHGKFVLIIINTMN